MLLKSSGVTADDYQPGSASYLRDPAGDASPVGASAPRIDPAVACSRAGAGIAAAALVLLSCIAVGGGSRGSSDATRLLILDVFPRASLDTMFTFNNEADVCNEFGDGPAECGVATDFFAGYEGSDADFLVARSSLGGARPRDQGAALNVGLSAFTRAPCDPTCSMSIVLDGYTITTNSINWASATSFDDVASIAQDALNAARPVQANFIANVVPGSASLIGVVNAGFTTISAGNPLNGGIMALTFGTDGRGLMLMNQVSGTAGGAGVYTSWISMQESTYYSGVITETYGVLTITAMTSGTVKQGDAVYDTTDNLLVPQGIMSYISGGLPTCTGGVCSCSGLACVGTKWVVPRPQTVASEAMFDAPNSVQITYNPIAGPSGTWGMMWVEPNAYSTYINPAQIYGGWPTGSAAQLMGLTQGSSGMMANGQVKSAILSTSSEVLQDQCAWFRNSVKTAPVQYVQYVANLDMGYSPPTYTNAFSACTRRIGVGFLKDWTTTTPAFITYPPTL
jgi:hypothetical protein